MRLVEVLDITDDTGNSDRCQRLCNGVPEIEAEKVHADGKDKACARCATPVRVHDHEKHSEISQRLNVQYWEDALVQAERVARAVLKLIIAIGV